MQGEGPVVSRLTRALGIAGFAIAVAVFGARIYMHYVSNQSFEKVYPKIEELVAIHSLVAWKSPNQPAPEIVEMGDRTGNRYDLQCRNIQWLPSEKVRPGALLNCFLESRRVLVPIEGKEVDSVNVVPDPDFWYDFKWQSYFGYELSISVNKSPREYLAVEEDIRKKFINPCAEQGNFGEDVRIYQFRIENLPSDRSVTFYAASGWIDCFPDGTVDRKQEWTLYVDDMDKPITIGEINRFMQVLLRQLNIADTDPSAAAPKLETLWRNKDTAFAANLVSTFEKMPDLTKIGTLLSR